MTLVVVEDPDAERYTAALASHFPGVRFAGLILTSTRGMHATQMGEMVLTQMLVLARDVPRSVLSQQQRPWERWYPQVLSAGDGPFDEVHNYDAIARVASLAGASTTSRRPWATSGPA
ncbi:MAG TPA: hypothetical protein VHY31_11025 [Streptosporangiaceae bacterium]|nr:hypothetical protein [Streptosporangiaceae bacterium]